LIAGSRTSSISGHAERDEIDRARNQRIVHHVGRAEGCPFGGHIEARRFGVLLDEFQLLHHHILHVANAELLGDANDICFGQRGFWNNQCGGQNRDSNEATEHAIDPPLNNGPRCRDFS
jgi:hypothetical protein